MQNNNYKLLPQKGEGGFILDFFVGMEVGRVKAQCFSKKPELKFKHQPKQLITPSTRDLLY